MRDGRNRTRFNNLRRRHRLSHHLLGDMGIAMTGRILISIVFAAIGTILAFAIVIELGRTYHPSKLNYIIDGPQSVQERK